MSSPLLSEIRVVNFRTARRLTLRPGSICALIGEPGAGKSNMLLALRALLDPGFDLSRADIPAGADAVALEANVRGGGTIALDRREGAPPILYFPVTLRGGDLVAPVGDGPAVAGLHGLIRRALEEAPAPRVALVRGLEACTEVASNVVFAIEEPELFLAPQAHRYLRRLIHRLAEQGNQVFFTTHSPGLLSVAALDEVVLVARDELGVTTVERLQPVGVDDAFRVMAEFDAERSELFFSRAAILVEGLTEKLTFPLVFHALGYDADREQISIVECGGKSNMPLFVDICKRARVPYVVVHDSDLRNRGAQALEATLVLNALIRRKAGKRRTIVLEPDFEGVVGYRSRARKPKRGWSRLAHVRPEDLPQPLVQAVELALRSAHPREPTYS